MMTLKVNSKRSTTCIITVTYTRLRGSASENLVELVAGRVLVVSRFPTAGERDGEGCPDPNQTRGGGGKRCAGAI
jgi:hypothetical protein